MAIRAPAPLESVIDHIAARSEYSSLVEGLFERCLNYRDALFDTSARSVDDDMFALPWIVVPRDHLFPGRQSQSGNVREPRFHAVSMFVRIRALNLNFNRCHVRAVRYSEPSIASKRKWINRVCNHCSTDAEIVLGDRITDTIPSVIESFADRSGFPDGLLNRVDTQMHGTELASQFSGNHRLSSAWKAAKDD
jgi:hypothetical protein